MSRYQNAYSDPCGPGDARPTALQIVKDEGLEGKMTDNVFFITGCSNGIGVETARALHATGATLFVTGRDVAKTQAVIKEILDSDPSNRAPIHFIRMELDSLQSVRNGVNEFRKKSSKLNVLINNAGVRDSSYYTSIDLNVPSNRSWQRQKERLRMASRHNLGRTT
jgi:NAD(P)-dependent dehydrogenase (short-subunit alcohol dehydrogenase family)